MLNEPWRWQRSRGSAPTLRSKLQRVPIVSHKALDAFCGELVSDVKAVPRRIQIEVFVWNRLELLAVVVDGLIAEARIRLRHTRVGPTQQQLGRRRSQFRPNRKGAEQMIELAQAGRQDMHMTVAMCVHLLD